MRLRKQRYEIGSTGPDSAVQFIGADPVGGTESFGIRVPTAASSPPDPRTRYMFVLAAARFRGSRTVRLVGARQFASIGASVQSDPDVNPAEAYIVEREIKQPQWHFSDGNIWWGIRIVRPKITPLAGPNDAKGVRFLRSQTPGLIYSATKPSYQAPHLPGDPVRGDVGSFYDLRFRHRGDTNETSLDIPIQGPCDVMFIASVAQTNPTTRPRLILPSLPTSGALGLPEEDGFLQIFPSAVYWRVAGTLVFEEELAIK